LFGYVSEEAAKRKRLLFALDLLSGARFKRQPFVAYRESPANSNLKLPFVGLVGVLSQERFISPAVLPRFAY